MRSRLTRLGAALAALAALAVGGSTLASAAHNTKPAKLHSAQPGTDSDNVQQGDQSAPDRADSADAGSESPQSESESGPSDGPGGYADSSANADTQQQGEH